MIKDAIISYCTQVFDDSKVGEIKDLLQNDYFTDKINKIIDIRFNKAKHITLTNRIQLSNEIDLFDSKVANGFISKLIKHEIVRWEMINNTVVFKRLHSDHNIFHDKPYSEVFVYDNDFEGIHIRSENVARGGFRWSTMRNFRSEVMSLAKTQNFKNVVIVPHGAKGGFFIKNNSKSSKECYEKFISAILFISDNYDNQQEKKHHIAYDNFDPYVVVAADKGTSSFSDLANSISKKYNFWLDDAFASGGSNGYSHKGLGITSLGAWESAKAKFEKLGFNFGKSSISGVFVGSPVGDVAGNGMLQYKNMSLKAAISSKFIFIDPNPNIEIAYNERQRLFNNEVDWSQYDKTKISIGGGLFSRSEKTILLSKEIQDFLQIQESQISPNELIKAIFRASVDVLFMGGIGTYFKSTNEEDSEIKDKDNDAIRLPSSEIGAKIFIEGANLSITHHGRVEYAQKGGLVYGDFIENAGGVMCSDAEVNLKILLKNIPSENRNNIIKNAEQEIVKRILETINEQSFAIQKIADNTRIDVNLLIKTNEYLCDIVGINSSVLLSEKDIQKRILSGKKILTEPEIAICFSGLKLDLKRKIQQINLSKYDDLLFSYFPTITHKFKNEIQNHPLKQGILCSILAGKIVNKHGFNALNLCKNCTKENIQKYL